MGFSTVTSPVFIAMVDVDRLLVVHPIHFSGVIAERLISLIAVTVFMHGHLVGILVSRTDNGWKIACIFF